MSDYIIRDEIFSVWRSMPKPASISSLTDAINRTPAADVEPVVRANWQLLAGSPGTFRCSNCGAEFEENPYAKHQGKWIGCPACRAQMQMIMDLEEENDG